MVDKELISRYALERSEEAFAALVRQHVDLVFATAMRQLGDRTLAEEVTQNVFIALAKKAGSLHVHPTVAGWLHRTTLLECRFRLRTELRRRRKEATVSTALAESPRSDSLWKAMIPLLDEALLSLPEPERITVTLRFLEEKSLREVGQILGTTEDTARKRVNKSLEMLTTFFRKNGFAISSLTATSPLFTISSQAAPCDVATGAITAAINHTLNGASTASQTKSIIKIMALTKAKKTAVALAVLLICTGTAFVVLDPQNENLGLSEADKNIAPPKELQRMLNAKEIAIVLMAHARTHEGRFPKSWDEVPSDIKAKLPGKVDWLQWEIVAPSHVSELANPGKTILVREKHPDAEGVRALGFDGGYAETRKENQ